MKGKCVDEIICAERVAAVIGQGWDQVGSEEPDSLGPEGQAGWTGVRRHSFFGPSADCLGLDGCWPACWGLHLSRLFCRAKPGACSWEFNQGPLLEDGF